jgi:large subunit ribosomal protein L25
MSKQIELVSKLPPTLIRFFQRFPPRDPSVHLTEPPPNPPEAAEKGKVPAWPNNRHVTATHPLVDPSYNPFLPWQNPTTGRWRPPMYSLRRQAMICRAARVFGVEELLPWSLKKSSVKEEKKERGVMVKGTGVGQRPKGHLHERRMVQKLEERKQAMLKMPEMIREWKLVSDNLTLRVNADTVIERAWQILEEMAEMMEFGNWKLVLYGFLSIAATIEYISAFMTGSKPS